MTAVVIAPVTHAIGSRIGTEVIDERMVFVLDGELDGVVVRELVVVGRAGNLDVEGEVAGVETFLVLHVDRDVLGGIPGESQDTGSRLDGEVGAGLGRTFDHLEGNRRVGIPVLRIGMHGDFY